MFSENPAQILSKMKRDICMLNNDGKVTEKSV